jgi:hypothetical protein
VTTAQTAHHKANFEQLKGNTLFITCNAQIFSQPLLQPVTSNRALGLNAIEDIDVT